MIKLRGLQQRLALYMFLPVAILLAGMGIAGFIYARNILITEWGEAATLKLQRAAHNVDMRLGRAKEWLKMFHTTGDNPYAGYVHELVIKQLEELDGVTRVNLTWTDARRPLEVAKRGLIPLRKGSSLQVTLPRYDSLVANKTVALVSDLKYETGRTVGKLEVVLNFDYLIDTILASGWWQSDQAYLVDDSGKILSSARPDERRRRRSAPGQQRARGGPPEARERNRQVQVGETKHRVGGCRRSPYGDGLRGTRSGGRLGEIFISECGDVLRVSGDLGDAGGAERRLHRLQEGTGDLSGQSVRSAGCGPAR